MKEFLGRRSMRGDHSIDIEYNIFLFTPTFDTYKLRAPPCASANSMAWFKHCFPPSLPKNSFTIPSILGIDSSPSVSKSYISNVKFDSESILNVHTFHTLTMNSKKSTSPPPVVSKCVKHLSVQGAQSRSKCSRNCSSWIAPVQPLIWQNSRHNCSMLLWL